MLLLDVFDYGTAPFRALNTEFRSRVIEEAAAAGADLVFSLVPHHVDPRTGRTRRAAARAVAAPGHRQHRPLTGGDGGADTGMAGY